MYICKYMYMYIYLYNSIVSQRIFVRVDTFKSVLANTTMTTDFHFPPHLQ